MNDVYPILKLLLKFDSNKKDHSLRNILGSRMSEASQTIFSRNQKGNHKYASQLRLSQTDTTKITINNVVIEDGEADLVKLEDNDTPGLPHNMELQVSKRNAKSVHNFRS